MAFDHFKGEQWYLCRDVPTPSFWSMLLLSVEKTYVVSQACEILFAIACAMFVVATWHFVITFYRTIRALSSTQTDEGGLPGFLDDSRAWHAIMRDALFFTQCLLGDAVAIYRCWILWDRDFRVVVFPLVLLTSSIGMQCFMDALSGSMACQKLANSPSVAISDPALWDWIAVFYALALGQNTITTGLMAFRLWLVDRRSMAYNVGRSQFYSTMLLLVESAALYFALQIVVLTAFLTKSNIQLVLLGSIPPIICVDGTTQTRSLRSLNMRNFGIAVQITETIDISRDSSPQDSVEKIRINDSPV
ncbi:hypothetical protein FB451DRAFT_1363086 [Mycena latifolia]|nr:hypothetical protein FB451DRAFT_1363086 [Mycena latifolia]